MVCLGQGWYPKGMHKNAWYLKGFLRKVVLSWQALFRVPQVVSLRTSGGCVATLARLPLSLEIIATDVSQDDNGGALMSDRGG